MSKTLTLRKPVNVSSRVMTPPPPNVTVDITGHVNRCYVLIGLPATGKSVWCDTILHNWKIRAKPMVLCEDDLVREECERTGDSYKEVIERFDFTQQKEILLERFHSAIGVSRDIIIDRHNLTMMDRDEYLRLLPDSYQKIAVVFFVPPHMLHARLLDRHHTTGRGFSPSVIENMRKRFERPGDFEFDRITNIDHTCRFINGQFA